MFEPFLFYEVMQCRKDDMDPLKRGNLAFFLILFSLGFLSCSSEKQAKEEAVALDTAVLRQSELLQTGIGKLEKWTGFWESKGADFGPGNFNPYQEHGFETVEWPEENPLSPENPLKRYQIPNPSSQGVVDIYHYKILVDPSLRVSLNPDAEVVYYKHNGMRERLLFIGPSGMFEDAAWVDDDKLLVSGHLQKEEGFVPIVWLVFPETKKYFVYESSFSTQDYSPDAYLREKLENLEF